MALAIHSTRIAIAASPAPRKTALIMNRSVTPPLAPIITRANRVPVETTPSSAPMIRSRFGAKRIPVRPTTAPTPRPMMIDWMAARAAPSVSPSPIRRATTADAPTDRPMAIA